MKYTKPMSTVSREVKRKAQSTTLTTLMRISITFLFFSLIAAAGYSQDGKKADNLPADPLIREAVEFLEHRYSPDLLLVWPDPEALGSGDAEGLQNDFASACLGSGA